MTAASLSSGFYAGSTKVSKEDLLKHKARSRHKRNRRAKRLFVLIAKVAVAILALALLVRSTVVEAFYVPSSSMAPTLGVQDRILVEKARYGLRVPFLAAALVSWAEPKRGEIVVFRRPDAPGTLEDESESTLVKRVIGVGGDIIQLDGARVIVNGELLEEPYAAWDGAEHISPMTFLVPKGALLVLGDNRANSFDSRFWENPFVPSDQVIGKAALVYWRGARD